MNIQIFKIKNIKKNRFNKIPKIKVIGIKYKLKHESISSKVSLIKCKSFIEFGFTL